MPWKCTLPAGIFLILAAAAGLDAAASDPLQRGPYPVGVRTEVFVDSSRECAVVGGPRTLVTEIWYPSTDKANAFPRNTFSDFWVNPSGVLAAKLAISRFGGDFEQIEKTFRNQAYRGAPIRQGAYPLLVFSHGNGGFRHQNTFQAEYLASHGYIVVAPDHTGNAAVTVLPDRIVPYRAETRQPERRDDRPQDVSFLVSHLTDLAGSDSHWLSGRLQPDTVGAFGHSFGGFTVCRVTELDDRIRAIVPMTLAGTAIFEADGDPGAPCPIPLMVILGEVDRTVGELGNQRSTAWYERATGPKYLLNFRKAGHFTFTEMPQINPDWGDGVGVERNEDGEITFEFSDPLEDQRITNAYTTAFFDAFLKNDAAARAFIGENRFPEEFDYRHAEPQQSAAK